MPQRVWADLPDTIDKVKPSVVIVGFYRSTDTPRFGMRGTGFAVGNGHLIATNAHVVQTRPDEAADRSLVVQVSVGGRQWQMRSATVVELDAAHDLALLKIDGAALPTLELEDGDAAREGQAVAMMGFPIGGALGFSPVTHRAMISSITPISLPAANGQQLSPKVIRSLRAGTFNIFQLDGTAYPGNSGGPLFDTGTGAVLGVVNMVFVKGTKESVLTHPSGISYAIPSIYVRDLVRRHVGG
ncbi:MAG: serine protease [Burkholderiales bacterium]